MRLIEPFKNSKKEHDPEKIMAYHEAGHGLVQVSFGLLPEYTSLYGFNGTLAFNSSSFFTYWNIGVDWEKEGFKYALMLNFGGIIGASYYTGFYNWGQAQSDIEKAEQTC